MKKFAAIFLAGILALSLTACVDRTENSSSSSMPSSSSSMPSSSSSEPSSSSSEPSSSSSEPLSTPTMSADFAQIGALDKTPITWGWGPHVDENNRSVGCQQLQEQYGKYNAFFIGPENGKLYLTFDEGYENGYTSKILDALKEKDAQAVFFVTMHYVKSNPDLIQRMIDEGHIVGNHSVTHPDFTTIPLQTAYDEVKELHDYMLENYDYTMSLFRYPTGAFNEQTLAMLDQMGYRTIFWSFGYADWDPENQMGAQAAYDQVTQALHSGGIYLLHAVSKDNAEILPEFIDYVRQQGYTVSPFDLDKSQLSDLDSQQQQ